MSVSRLMSVCFPRIGEVMTNLGRAVGEDSAAPLLDRFPPLEIVAVAAEYQEGLRHLRSESQGPRLILWLGSNIGNFTRQEAAEFLRRIRDTMSPLDRM